MKKTLEIIQDEKQIFVGVSNEEFKSPVEIRFVIEKDTFTGLEKATAQYKWSIYEALAYFCEHADEMVGTIEAMVQHVGRYQKD